MIGTDLQGIVGCTYEQALSLSAHLNTRLSECLVGISSFQHPFPTGRRIGPIKV